MKTKYGFETTKSRSTLMSKIKSKNTSSELLLRKELWSCGIRYRINDKRIFGKPDILISKYKIAIFVDGEFWHGYNWEVKRNKIRSNKEYWINKIENNIKNDILVTSQLSESGWKVLRFWDSDLKKDIKSVVSEIIKNIP